MAARRSRIQRQVSCPGEEVVPWLPSCGGRGVADGQPDGPVAEIGHEVQPATEGLDVAGDDLEGEFMAPVSLPAMSPSQQEGWLVLLDLTDSFPDGWCLVGGQMVWLLAAEYGVEPLRTTDDVDIDLGQHHNDGQSGHV